MDLQNFTLNNGVVMPSVGFGTWQISPDSAAEDAVRSALETGYRHLDTAKIYENERGVGAGIKASGVPREEIFVTTKLWNGDQGYESGLAAIDESLQKLGLEYVDLYLIHWPQTGTRDDAWRAMEEIYKIGKTKSVGVSNYTVRHLEELAAKSDLVPAVNQIELHPYIYEQQKPVLEYCQQKGILVEAYSPLARHSREDDTRVVDIANRLGKTPSQVLLRWCLQHGTAPLPRSTNPDHIRENFELFDFELSEDDMKTLDGMSDGERITSDPESIA
jgi:diketogulonate reductase-like aldo/keto reductase